MPDELAMAVAVAVAAKAAEVVVGGTKGALGALLRLIRERFGAGTREADALREAVDRPDERGTQVALADALARTMAQDPVFEERVLSYWETAKVELSADRGSVVNQFTGRAEKSLQARDIRGDVHF